MTTTPESDVTTNLVQTRTLLVTYVEKTKKAYEDALSMLEAFDRMAVNNVFDTLAHALGAVEDKLLERARLDCEGSYNCGAEEYTQEFMVDGVTYLGTLRCEYNRHDKTFYYVEESNFSYAVIS